MGSANSKIFANKSKNLKQIKNAYTCGYKNLENGILATTKWFLYKVSKISKLCEIENIHRRYTFPWRRINPSSYEMNPIFLELSESWKLKINKISIHVILLLSFLKLPI